MQDEEMAVGLSDKEARRLNQDFAYDNDYNAINGLTPPTTNIRNRKFRKRRAIDVWFWFFVDFRKRRLGKLRMSWID